MDAAVEIGRNPVSEHEIQPEFLEDGNAGGVLRENFLGRARV